MRNEHPQPLRPGGGGPVDGHEGDETPEIPRPGGGANAVSGGNPDYRLDLHIYVHGISDRRQGLKASWLVLTQILRSICN